MRGWLAGPRVYTSKGFNITLVIDARQYSVCVHFTASMHPVSCNDMAQTCTSGQVVMDGPDNDSTAAGSMPTGLHATLHVGVCLS